MGVQYIDQVLIEMYNSEVKNRRVHINDEFNESSCFKAMYYIDKIVKLDEIEGKPIKDRKPITIIINSYGGQLYECLGLIGKIESLQEKGYIIDTEVTGKAMSCGQLTFMFGTNRRVGKYSTILIHELSNVNYGNFTNLKIQAAEDNRLNDMLENLIIKKTNITRELLRDKIRGTDWYLSPEDCIKYGLATEII